MCLDTVTRSYDVPQGTKEFWVWKRFSFNGGNGEELYSPVMWNKYKRGKWYKAKQKNLKGFLVPKSYKSGFHCLLNKDDCDNASYYGTASLRIKARGIIARGVQDDLKTVVVKEIFIPKDAVV